MGAPATLPEAVVAEVLEDAGIGLTHGTNLFSGPEQPGNDTGIPAAAVFIATYGGTAPVPYCGASADLREIAVQVLVRGTCGDFAGCSATAWSVWQSLQRITQPATGYIDIRATQSAPVYLGFDSTDRPRYSINILLRFRG